VRRVLNKHSKATAMSEVYWECPMGFRWAWKDKDVIVGALVTWAIYTQGQLLS